MSNSDNTIGNPESYSIITNLNSWLVPVDPGLWLIISIYLSPKLFQTLSIAFFHTLFKALAQDLA